MSGYISLVSKGKKKKNSLNKERNCLLGKIFMMEKKNTSSFRSPSGIVELLEHSDAWPLELI